MRKNVRKCQKMHEFLTFFAFVTNYLAFSHIFPHCLHFFAELDISLHFLASCGNGPNSPAWHFFEVDIFLPGWRILRFTINIMSPKHCVLNYEFRTHVAEIIDLSFILIIYEMCRTGLSLKTMLQ